ncbi:uncharacterized protein LOC135837941 [Planococcus citri]|uniref:uncharacterized protein LOC135837941 n=1 Tax=Planococcus citri TaxID=170843 RepID=UPI0031F8187C
MMDDSPMKLLSLAAKSVCVQLVYEWADGEIPTIDVWERITRDDGGLDADACPAHSWFLWQLREMRVPRFAHIPDKIRYQIEDNIPPILEEVMTWILYHHFLNFFHDEPSSSLSEYIVKLVWNRRFEIDNSASAKNILTNDKLTPLERFKFASAYCIVDEIEKYRDTIDSVPEWESIGEPFVAYWYRYLTNKLDTIDVSKDYSIEMWYLKTSEESILWPSVVYFFDEVDSTSRSNEFVLILETFAESYLSDLLAKLTDNKWNLACCSMISRIVQKIVQYGSLDQVRFVWKLFESKIDSKNFAEILETLVLSSMRNAKDFDKWTPMLMEIWTSASSKLKQSAIVDTKLWQSIGEKCMSIIAHEETADFRTRRRQITDPMQFIKLVLNSIPAKQRLTFFENNFCWLIVWAPFAVVDQLMRDVLQNDYDHDVVELKKIVANCSEIERLRGILIAFGEFDELDTLVSFYFPGVDGISAKNEAAMQKKLKFHKFKFILSENVFDPVCFCIYRGDWKPLYEYVQKNVTWISPVGLEAIMKKVILQGKCWPRKIHKGEMNDLKEFVSTVYSNANPADQDSVDAQLKFLKIRYESYLLIALFDHNLRKKIVFDRANLKDFLLWIYKGDENLIDENFKQPSLFPRGFLVQLKGCVTEGSFRVTESMDEFLKWCFETEAERQQFKRRMIYDYRQYPLIEGLLMRRQYRQKMLFWVFDDDVSLIEKFTVDCVGHPMCPYFVSGYGDSDDSESDDSEDEDD